MTQIPALNHVQFNTYHSSGFEMDVFDPQLNINVELDGPSHASHAHRKHDDERDTILRKFGVVVHRLPLTTMTMGEVVTAVQAILARAKADGARL